MVPDTDITDLLSRAPDLMKNGAELVSALKVTQFLRSLFGKATDQVADQLATEVRRWCFIRQLELFAKTQQMLQGAGLKPFAVLPKTLFPLLEGAAIEDDEDLHTKFAALLARASSPEYRDGVEPSFIKILEQMTPDEARVLDDIYQMYGDSRSSLISDRDLAGILCGLKSHEVDPADVWEVQGLGNSILDGLEAQLLIRRIPLSDFKDAEAQVYPSDGLHHLYSLTARGKRFAEACRPPRPN